MALEIIDKKIVGTIDNLQEKLEGKLPVDRLELIELINSWGRIDFFYTQYLDEDVKIEQCKATQSEQAKLVRKECYKLSKLNVTKITNMVDVFIYSLFEGDISEWNTSNVTNMDYMFYQATNFNSNIGNWDVSNVTKMDYMFNNAEKFNQNISSWNLDNIKSSYSMFDKAKAFLDKYNSGKPLSSYTDKTKEWIINNRDRMNMIDLKEKHGDEIDSFFSKFSSNKIEILK